ncbi:MULTISPECIES: ParB/RepB/Spo0J family partition protein [Caballeronia]|uniref:ParB/RepB/Spo0J family partition protein n=1 Tax=Caballeronia TaxID=1827195 RepID=UPI001FCF82CF|nr:MULTISPECIES: ParB/RepB/Spo0J family partition protein [Caballeronia]MDR5799098.1 ParB/RepB/Spo0J family partition protein [Caballeronia sp. LZ001]
MKQSRRLGYDPQPGSNGEDQPKHIQGVRVAELPPTNIDRSMSEILREKGIAVDGAAGAATPAPTMPSPAVNGSALERSDAPQSAAPHATSVSPARPQAKGVGRATTPDVAPKALNAAVLLALEMIDPSPYQPRIIFDEEALASLADTISDSGLNNPVIVRLKSDGRYELIAGERRLLAHKLLRLPTIAAFVRELSDADAAIMATTDNDAREDLADFERGRSYKRLLDDKVVENQRELARRVGRSMATVSRCLAYFKLPSEVVEMLTVNPLLVGTKVVADLVSFAEQGYRPQVIEAVSKIEKTKLSQESALNWLKTEVRRMKNPSVVLAPRSLHIGGKSVAEVKVDGRKLILQCPKDVNPETLLKAIEKMLTGADLVDLTPTSE